MHQPEIEPASITNIIHCVQAARRHRLCLPPAADLGISGGRQTTPTSAQLPQRRFLISKGRRLNINLTITVVGFVGMFSLLLCRSFGIMPPAKTEPSDLL